MLVGHSRLRPFLVEGSPEPLELAVPAGGVGRREDVADAELTERGLEGVAGVGLGVVGHDGLRRLAALLEHPGHAAAQRGADRGGGLGGVQLGVDQAAVVVEHPNDDALAQPPLAHGTIAVRPMPGAVKALHRERVDVQQRSGLRPLITAMRLALAAAPARDPVALEHLVDRRAMPAAQHRQAHRPPIRPRACPQNLLLGRVTQRPRTRPRDRPTGHTPHPADALLDAGGKPTIARRRHRRGRAPHRPRDRARLLAGEKARDHLTLRARSEPASTVRHVRPSFGAFSRGDRKPPSEAGRSFSAVQ